MPLGKTASYYHSNPAANARRLSQQRDYDNGTPRIRSKRSKKGIQKYHATLAAWKKRNAGSKPAGVAEAVHDKNGKIRWAAGSAARSHNRGNEVRKRNKASNPKGAGA